MPDERVTGDWLLRCHLWLVAAMVPLAVRVLPLRSLLWLIRPPRWWRPYRHVMPERVVELVRRRLARPIHMRRRACLRESLTLFHFLLLTGRPAVLHFGVYAPNAPGNMHGHCWVTLEGRPLNAPPGAAAAQVHQTAPLIADKQKA